MIDWKLINQLQTKRLNNYKWVRTEYDKLLWTKRIEVIPSFGHVFDPTKNITKMVMQKYDLRINGAILDHAITSIKGETGSGKSMCSISLNLMLFGDTFTSEYIKFTNNDILELCKEIKQKRGAIQDEQPESVGMGSYREATEMKNLEEITRKYQLSLTFNAPTERIHETAHFNLEIIEKSTISRVLHVAVFDRKIEQYMGFIIIPVLPDKHPLIVEYIKKKDLFIQSTLKRSNTRLDVKTMFKQLSEHPDIGKAKNKNHINVIVKGLFPTLTTQEHKYLSDYYDLHNPKKDELVCEKCDKKTMRKYRDTLKCYVCGLMK